MKHKLALIISKQGAMQNGLLALLTTIPQISTVLVTDNVNSGLQMLEEHRPTLLLLDMDLPQDGAQIILKRIEQKRPFISTIVLINNSQQRQKAASFNVDGVLLKGFSAQKFIATVEEILSDSHSSSK